MLEKNEGDDIGNDNEGTYVRSLAVLSFVWDRKANLPKKRRKMLFPVKEMHHEFSRHSWQVLIA